VPKYHTIPEICIGSIICWSVYAAEIMAIYYATCLIYQIAMKDPVTQRSEHEPATILNDSMSALQVIANAYPLEQALVESYVKAAIEETDTGFSAWGESLRPWVSPITGYNRMPRG
jgi:hypothetical protein